MTASAERVRAALPRPARQTLQTRWLCGYHRRLMCRLGNKEAQGDVQNRTRGRSPPSALPSSLRSLAASRRTRRIASDGRCRARSAATWSHLGTSGVRFTKNIERVSDGNFEIKFYEPGALVPALECFDAASKGSVEACWTTPGYHTGKIPALAFFTSVPFGPQYGEFFAWKKFHGGDELKNEIYGEHGLYSLDVFAIGPETSGWFRKPIELARSAERPEDALLRPRRPGHAEARRIDPAARGRRHLSGAGARRDRRHRVLDARHRHRPRLLPGRQEQLLSGLASAGLGERAADEQGGLGGAAGPVQGDDRARCRGEHPLHLRRDRGDQSQAP